MSNTIQIIFRVSVVVVTISIAVWGAVIVKYLFGRHHG